ncbi:Na(+)/H(+) antiporter subunit D [Halorubrum ezzemoulense]|uniref:Na(+)/H(+) antiporter subunit D n=1 Tax=Halorubrum ezzemoulense TaxID=337243 RepID=A0ABT4Z1L0_HALEZ|nr:Na(+)/H(+) antiporter subunit D [Halorubrum ezzemoulense]MDB2244581.1 Na(+)/H(+) antiporter subunit D [Halorubrum ezzemoulense]MDB2250788.1 Na(+)/H(+) antiporter subunit D [Halorubrum ezzemoulense]MDB2278662.1 Na(+)/H(+) antiporter subunit D [Halorubrum ezzemoulense]MDB2285336.1 Na(+)/H(+) antiporter subunit D [Halorubrum ezzemoulense]MDB2287915.1 Na(+)/H(+) antiporter subunit D [Halorubrum ezzemoulense]
MTAALTALPPGPVLLVIAALIALTPRRVGHALGVAASGVAVAWAWTVPAGAHLQATFLGFDAILLNVDEFSRLMGLIFGIIGVVAVLYSYASEAESIQTAFAFSYVATSFGAVFAGDWLTLLFFWELMAVTSTLLVWHYRGEAVRAGFRYALLHGLGGTLLMAAILGNYVAKGTFLFATVPGGPETAGIVAGLPAALAAVGIGVNVGFIGLHAWLPDTYPRPHIAASVFLCVFTTKTGVYGMYRAFPDGHVAIAYMGGGMAVFGATFALFQNDMRRLLSYHIQSQVGYMIAGVGIGSALSQAGAFAHVFNHILYKGLLFMTAGVVVYRTGEESLKKLGGLARDMPVTAGAFTIAALSIAGFPGFNGFVSKGIIISGSHYTFPKGPLPIGDFHTLEWLLLLGGIGTFMSFIKFGYYAFFHGSYDGDVRDANRGQSVAMGAVAVLCVAYGVLVPTSPLAAVVPADVGLFGILPFDVTSEAVVEKVYKTYTVDHLIEGVALAVLGLIGFALTKRPLSKLGRVPDVDSLYNPAVLYGTRGLVVGVTELYAAVDRAVVGLTTATVRTVTDPQAAVRRVGSDVEIKSGIGRSVLILTLAVGIALFGVLFL